METVKKSRIVGVGALMRFLIILLCAAISIPFIYCSAEDAGLITDFNALMTAVQNAEDGDTLLVGDIDFSPLSPDVPNSMMFITLEKSLTIKSGKAEGAALFLNGAFVLSGSKLTGEKISLRFENIVFDGKADYGALTEKDYEHPWSEAEQVYTYNASTKAQQALAFMGNVDADFSGCVFRNYMHEYGPVIDIRYADYTGNEYINLPDYSGCSLNLNFDNCRIEKNSALYDGGAIYIEANKNVVLNAKDSVFADNRSTNGEFSRGGGAIYAEGATLSFSGCTLENNTANHVFADTALPEYDTHRGGAILLQSSKLIMTDTLVSNNRASMGGAISFTNSGADMDGCRFISNRAEAQAIDCANKLGPWSNMSQGGAMYIEGNNNDTVTLINCEIKDNFAVNAYGGIYGYYVPFEDPSLPTYNIRMILCDYVGNRDGVDYDYSTVGDLLWMSHPGDMFANPHMTLFGCLAVDETFESDFPRDEAPSADNGYNYLSSKSDEDIRAFAIPADEAAKHVGGRYEGKLTAYHIGSNYSESLYREPEPIAPETSSPETEGNIPDDEKDSSALPIILALIAAAAVIAAIALIHFRRKPKAEPLPPAEEKRIVMTRYDDAEIERFISLCPEAGLLTARELEVLREILRGKKQGEVAYYLGIGVSTVKDFYKKIYTKLNVPNKDGLFLMISETLKKQ